MIKKDKDRQKLITNKIQIPYKEITERASIKRRQKNKEENRIILIISITRLDDGLFCVYYKSHNEINR